jgi:hypothetical protein
MVNAEYPVPQSTELIAKAVEKIKTSGLEKEITLLTAYLSDEACLEELSKADLVVFPYQETGESSSAAVRYGIASGAPVAVTPLKIFDDVAPAVFKLSGTKPEAMAQSLGQMITEIQKGSENILQVQKHKEKWAESHRYAMLGKRLSHMLSALHRKKIL